MQYLYLGLHSFKVLNMCSHMFIEKLLSREYQSLNNLFYVEENIF